ncbi:MAG: radical SAM protein, partial [Candidatus Hydrogenedentota bacterium]
VLVRHLVMPGQTDESDAIFRWLANEVSTDTYVNIMGQYRPAHRVGERDRHGNPHYTEIDRRLKRPELEEAVARARTAGLWRFEERL